MDEAGGPRCYRCGATIPHNSGFSRVVDKTVGYTVRGGRIAEPIEVYLCADCERHFRRFYRGTAYAIAGLLVALIVLGILDHFVF